MFLSLTGAGTDLPARSGRSWRVDETYVKIRGEWVYLYRAVDREGNTVDFRRSSRRDVAAAKAFFRQAMKSQGSSPGTITLDGCAASHRAVREMKADGELNGDTKVRSSKYLNNLIEQDHRGVKSRLGPMLDLKRFRTAAITITGIELLHRIKKGHFNLGRLRLKDGCAPAIWGQCSQCNKMHASVRQPATYPTGRIVLIMIPQSLDGPDGYRRCVCEAPDDRTGIKMGDPLPSPFDPGKCTALRLQSYSFELLR